MRKGSLTTVSGRRAGIGLQCVRTRTYKQTKKIHANTTPESMSVSTCLECGRHKHTHIYTYHIINDHLTFERTCDAMRCDATTNFVFSKQHRGAGNFHRTCAVPIPHATRTRRHASRCSIHGIVRSVDAGHIAGGIGESNVSNTRARKPTIQSDINA